jgi:tetratricopeptide (TPR) repeat protein
MWEGTWVGTHTHVTNDISNLGGLHHAQRQYLKAERAFERALVGRGKVLGREHPDTLTSVHNLAVLYRYQERYPESEKLFERSLAGRQEILGPEHDDR